MNDDCFTPKLPDIGCRDVPVYFYTIENDTVDDTVNPPKPGQYYNAIVVYNKTGNAYGFGTNGIPIKIGYRINVDDYLSTESASPVQNKVITEALNAETAAREEADTEHAQDIQENKDSIMALQEVTTENSTQIAANTQDIEVLETTTEAINTAIDKAVVSDIDIDSTTSTDVLQLTDSKVNIKTGAASTEQIPFPVASDTQAGVMNAATFNAVQSNSENVDVLLHSSVAVNDLSSAPTQDELTTAWEEATGKTEVVNGAKIYDATNDKIWTYFTNDATWHAASNGGGGPVTISQWTNTSAGIAKGSTNDGQIYAEADATGSVNGWDRVKSDIANNTSALNNKLDKVTSTETYERLYAIGTNGSQTVFNTSAVNVANSIPKRNGAGNFECGTPTNDNQVVNRGFVNTGLASKLDKVTSATEQIQLYGKKANGDQAMFNMAGGLVPSTVVYRDANNHINTSEPTENNHVANKSYVDGRQVELTQAEYDALTDEQKNANVEYFITDGVAENTLNTYSADEQRIGTWVDGKPLYRKTINFNLHHTTDAGVQVAGINGGNIRQIVNYYGCSHGSDNSYTGERIVIPYSYSGGERCIWFTTNGGNAFEAHHGSVLNSLPVTVTFEYTKIAD